MFVKYNVFFFKLDSKRQTIANLANFSYDPENHRHLINTLSTQEIFLDNIDSQDEFVAISSIKGLCNLAPNPAGAEFFGKKESLDKIIACIIERKKSIDYLINGLLLLATICQLNILCSGFSFIKLLNKLINI